jgi:hypothetical protein
MARSVALSRDEQRALERAVGEANHAAAQISFLTPGGDASGKKKRKKKRSHEETVAEDVTSAATEESRKKKKRKKEHSAVLTVEESHTSEVATGASLEGNSDGHRKHKKKRKERVEEPEQESVDEEREVEHELANDLVETSYGAVTPTPDEQRPSKRKNKNKGKHRTLERGEEALAVTPVAQDAPVSLDQVYTTPHALMSTLFSMAPTLSQDTDQLHLAQLALSQGQSLQSPSGLNLLSTPPAQSSDPTQDATQLLAELHAALGLPPPDEDAPVGPPPPGQNVPPEELMRIIEALQHLDAGKIPGVLKTLNDAAQAPVPPPAEGFISGPSSGVPITIPTPGSLPPGQIRATHVRPTHQSAYWPGPAMVGQRIPPVHQRPVTATAILGGSDVPLNAANSIQITAPHHQDLLCSKWLTAGQLAEMVKKEGAFTCFIPALNLECTSAHAGLVYKKGKFSKIEDHHLEQAIESFRVVSHLSIHCFTLTLISFTETRNTGSLSSRWTLLYKTRIRAAR